MCINAISTVEISIQSGTDIALEQYLADYVRSFRDLPGCIAYGVTQSAKSPHLWVLSGFWETQEAMVRHFSSVDIDQLIGALGRPVTSLQFGSFTKVIHREIDNAVR